MSFDPSKLDDGARATWLFLSDWVQSTGKVPAIREIAKGLNQSIRMTRRQFQTLQSSGLIVLTIRGWDAPGWWKQEQKDKAKERAEIMGATTQQVAAAQ